MMEEIRRIRDGISAELLAAERRGENSAVVLERMGREAMAGYRRDVALDRKSRRRTARRRKSA